MTQQSKQRVPLSRAELAGRADVAETMPISGTRQILRQAAVRLFWPALALYIFVLPIQHTVALRYVALAVLLVAVAMLLVASMRPPVFPLAWPWLTYGAAALLSLPFALAPDYSMSEVRVEVLYCMAVFVIAATAASILANPIRGVAMIVVTANTVYLAGAFAFLDIDSGMDALYRMPTVAFAGVNSNLLVTIMPLVAYAGVVLWQQGRRWLAVAVFGLLALDAVALVMSYNRQGLVALGTGVLCGGILVLHKRFTWRRLAALALLAALVGGLFSLQLTRRASPSVAVTVDNTVSQDPRWELWKLAFQGVADRPWTGNGFGRNTFSLLYPDVKAADKNHWHAHNMVLNKGVQMGIPGMLAFLLLWAALAREFIAHSRGGAPKFALSVAALSTLAAVFMKNMTDDFFVRDMALIFWLLMGFYIGTLRTWARREQDAV